jgi:importin subunit beta-1
VAQVLQQAAGVTATPDGPYEMFDYVISLREGIMDAWGGIIGAMKASGKSKFHFQISDVEFSSTEANSSCSSPSFTAICTVHLPAP